MRRLLRISLVVLAVAAGVFVALSAAWAVDDRDHHRVARNVSLAGRPVGGLPRAAVEARVAEIAARYQGAAVSVRAPRGSFSTTTTELGVAVREEATVRAVLRAGRTGAFPGRAWSWLRGFLANRTATVVVDVDANAAWDVVPRLDAGPRTNPVEPNVKVEGDELTVVEGQAGKGVDPRDVIAGLPAAARHGLPIVVRVDRGDIRPRFTEADAERVAEEGERVTRQPLKVTAGGQQAEVPAKTLRSWLRAEPTKDGRLVLAVNGPSAADDLGKLLPKVGTPPVETKFDVVGGVPRIVPGKPGTGCCAPAAAEVVERGLRERPATPVALPLRRVEPTLTVEKAQALGIREVVGTFQTKHAAGEPRVRNIHLIADMVRGHVIKPGETFSVNQVVGKRTREKGFVEAPVIYDAKLDTDVGGGVSQFATTLFNAAFFAGLEFGEYMSHTLYIPRYPYGREATMGFPHPDLQIKNVTSHGVLIWTSYTATSITVTLYSTKVVEATQTGQSEAPYGRCKRVTTERTRRYPDGTVKVDKVFATYQPEEGVRCP